MKYFVLFLCLLYFSCKSNTQNRKELKYLPFYTVLETVNSRGDIVLKKGREHFSLNEIESLEKTLKALGWPYKKTNTNQILVMACQVDSIGDVYALYIEWKSKFPKGK